MSDAGVRKSRFADVIEKRAKIEQSAAAEQARKTAIITELGEEISDVLSAYVAATAPAGEDVTHHGVDERVKTAPLTALVHATDSGYKMRINMFGTDLHVKGFLDGIRGRFFNTLKPAEGERHEDYVEFTARSVSDIIDTVNTQFADSARHPELQVDKGKYCGKGTLLT
jgi:hypothetical protein